MAPSWGAQCNPVIRSAKFLEFTVAFGCLCWIAIQIQIWIVAGGISWLLGGTIMGINGVSIAGLTLANIDTQPQMEFKLNLYSNIEHNVEIDLYLYISGTADPITRECTWT